MKMLSDITLICAILLFSFKLFTHYFLEKTRGREMSLISLTDYFPEIILPYTNEIDVRYDNLKRLCNKSLRLGVYSLAFTFLVKLISLIK